MSSSPALDTAAWASTWRSRAVGDKVLLAAGLLGIALLGRPWPTDVLVTVVSIGLVLGPAGVPWRLAVRAARGVAGFVVLGGLTLVVGPDPGPSARADVISTGWGLALTHTGLAHAGETTAHAVAGTSAMLLLAATTTMTDLLQWAGRRGVPAVVVEMADLTYRFVFLLTGTTAAIGAAQAARLGYATRRATLRSSAQLAAVVLARSWARAQRLDEGLRGRGYTGSLQVLTTVPASSRRFVAASVAGVGVIAALTWI